MSSYNLSPYLKFGTNLLSMNEKTLRICNVKIFECYKSNDNIQLYVWMSVLLVHTIFQMFTRLDIITKRSGLVFLWNSKMHNFITFITFGLHIREQVPLPKRSNQTSADFLDHCGALTLSIQIFEKYYIIYINYILCYVQILSTQFTYIIF